MMLTQLAAVARRTGCPVIEVTGWKTRGRPGEMLGVRTITCHHTANGGARGNYPSLRVVRDGRTDLPGPLAQYGLGVDGTIYVIAAGKCNHAGVSLKTDYTNSYAIGIEAEAKGVPGTTSDWPPKQMDAYVRLCRALYEEFANVQVPDIRGHKETCSPQGRKSDPDFVMATLRARVKAMDLTPPKPIAVKPVAVEDIMATKAELEALFVNLFKTRPLVPNKVKPGQKQGADWTLAGVLAASDFKADLTGENIGIIVAAVTQIAARQDQIESKIDALIEGLSTPDAPAPPTPTGTDRSA